MVDGQLGLIWPEITTEINGLVERKLKVVVKYIWTRVFRPSSWYHHRIMLIEIKDPNTLYN